MAKKRKASRTSLEDNESSRRANESSRLRINTYEDVADSEDEFHINRDKVFLDEEPAAKRRRKWEEQGMSVSKQFLEPSDEEVLAYSSPDSDDEAGDEELQDDDYADGGTSKTRPDQYESDSSNATQEEDEDAGGWGSSKRDYYDTDKIETEQDALDEEAEARRLQQKRLANMSEADFQFDESEWLDGESADEEDHDGVVTEVLPQLQITEEMGPAERLKLLKARYPEFEPLAKEFVDLEPQYDDLALAASVAESMLRLRQTKAEEDTTTAKLPLAVVKLQALTAYLAALSMYFALLTSTADAAESKSIAMAPTELHDHAIMDSLVKCRDLWTQVKDLQVPDSEYLAVNGDGAINGDREQLSHDIEQSQQNGIEVQGIEANGVTKFSAPRSTKKSKVRRALEAAQASAAALRAERLRKTEASLAALSSLTDASSRNRPVKSKASAPSFTLRNPASEHDDAASDLGDETLLTSHEAAEKAQRKKSLRFYTSQIAQKANKRGAAGRDAGGDSDLPYRERLKDRQARLNAEAEKRGRKWKDEMVGEDLGGESDDEDRRVARELRAEAAEGSADEDGYYDMVSSRSKAKKADKAARAVAYAEAAAQGGLVVENETVGEDGKRKINYAIEKNKGLTPRRKKDVRNPRVKKRKRFEDKKKKLGSMKAVYKGGEGKGGYGGELTGIKTGLVRSVKL